MEVYIMSIKKIMEEGWKEYVKYCDLKSKAYYC